MMNASNITWCERQMVMLCWLRSVCNDREKFPHFLLILRIRSHSFKRLHFPVLILVNTLNMFY